MTLINSDVNRWARTYRGEKFHAMFCDPPYELAFMNNSWDKSGVSFLPETWARLAEHLFPGAFGFVFAGSRTYHRIAVAIEDAGLIIHPMIGWVYGSGFPKASRIDKRIDTIAGTKQEIIGTVRRWGNAAGRERAGQYANQYESSIIGAEKFDSITIPSTPLAKAWHGHRYGLQALKPALEPIIVFQKPYDESAIDSISKTGAGAINVDGARIGAPVPPTGSGQSHIYGWANTIKDTQWGGSPGRWPANFIPQHEPECKLIGIHAVEGYTINRWSDNAHPFGGGSGNEYESEKQNSEIVEEWDCIDGCAIKALVTQGGNLTSGKPSGTKKDGQGIVYGKWNKEIPVTGFGDTGTAARYFYNSDWMLERLENFEQFYYQAKAARLERNAGLEHLPPNERLTPMAGRGEGGLRCRKCKKWKASGKPCKCQEPDFEQVKFKSIPQQNPHPTLKPIRLCQYLSTLLLPPDMYIPRRILIPFSGVCSEMIGAKLSGWEDVTGIELSEDYMEIGKIRLEFWESMIKKYGNNVNEILKINQKKGKKRTATKGRRQKNLLDIIKS